MHPSGVACSVPRWPGVFKSTIQHALLTHFKLNQPIHSCRPELVDDYWGLCLESHFRGRLVGTQSWEITFVITKPSRKCARLRMLKGQVESSAIKDCWVRSRDQTNLKKAHFSSWPKYHCSKQCLAGRCLKKGTPTVLSDFQTSNGSVASRAWEQTLLPDAVPVWSWTDIKVLETRQTGLFTGAEQPYHCCNGCPGLDCHYGSTLKERLWMHIFIHSS